IICEICCNESDAFSGFGHHIVNDMLFHAGEFSGVPSYFLCKDNTYYNNFKSKIQDYIGRLQSKKFHATIIALNSNNPFAFNYKSNYIYIDKFIDVL
ncbi:hypothetical protein BDZ97DRAFT_1608201, partial [Flammula alnicola]